MRPTFALVLALACLTAAGCADDQPARPTAAESRTTLRFLAYDRAGDAPSVAARESLVRSLGDRLRAIGEQTPRVTFTDEQTLEISLDSSESALVELARREVLRSVELAIRIRVSPHLENAERSRRDQHGKDYEPPPRTVWVSTPDGSQDMLVGVPEMDAIQQVERLATADPIDQDALAGAQMSLQRVLLAGAFTSGDIADAKAVHGIAQGGRSAVGITMRPERVEAFHKFTSLYVTQPYVVLVNGRVVYTALIMEPLGEQIVLGDPDGFTAGGAERLAESLRRAAYGTILEPLD